MRKKYIQTDILVIGGGMAGFFAAITARERGLDVTLTDKAYIGKSGSTSSYAGEILYFRPERGHKLKEWVDIICERSEYLNNQEWVETCLIESKDRYNDLVAWGVPFSTTNSELIVVNGDPTGQTHIYEIAGLALGKCIPALRKQAFESGIRLLDRIMVCDLLKQDSKIVGAIGLHTTDGDLYIFQTKAIVIATGGSSLKAGNHPSYYWTGDGETMAYRAGAEISGLEFAYGIDSGKFVGSNRIEYKRKLEQTKTGSGISRNIINVTARFPYAPDGSKIFPPTLNAEGGLVINTPWEAHCGRAPVYVDLDNVPPERLEQDRFQQRSGNRLGMPNSMFSIDLSKGGMVQCSGANIRTIPYPGGAGIWPIDGSCASGIPGLYSSGNSCATMGSGALYAGMGFGLNHAAVTGHRAGLGAAEYASRSKEIKLDETELKRVKEIVCAPLERKGGFSPAWLTQVLHGLTIPYFYLQVKHGERLQAALTLVEFLNRHLAPKLMAKDAHEWRMAQETKNMALIAEMMLRASLFRTESRGSHYREEYPRRDDPAWLAWVKLKEEEGQMKVYKEAIPKKWWPDLGKPYEERYPSMFPGE